MLPVQPGGRQQVSTASRQHPSALLHPIARASRVEVPESEYGHGGRTVRRGVTGGCGTLTPNHKYPSPAVSLLRSLFSTQSRSCVMMWSQPGSAMRKIQVERRFLGRSAVLEPLVCLRVITSIQMTAT
ncbi:unnamed protein product [Pleuronectes platessa]|uniref:Uncharacterized protein n=1 Tax=Pleuronectes platessa TaxID=8262 RepID=A0A9N7Z3Z2_PLEPL|nr:unnamed protein product [Pleuronectes platessa]